MIIQEKIGIDERINEAFQPISNFWEGLILHEFFGTGIPTIIFLLVGGAAFFTLYFGFTIYSWCVYAYLFCSCFIGRFASIGSVFAACS